jgi:type IV pilus assembly protein PilA
MFKHPSILKRLSLARERAFTLIELLVVILIVGILIAVAAPSFLGQVNKANDSVAQQNLYNVYISGKSAAWTPLSSYPYIGDPIANPGSPGDNANINPTSLMAILTAAGTGLSFGDGPSSTNVNQIGVQEPNPQTVMYTDTSASGTVFCLVDVEQATTNGPPAGTVWLSAPAGSATPCTTPVAGQSPPPPVPCPAGSGNCPASAVPSPVTGIPAGPGACWPGYFWDGNNCTLYVSSAATSVGQIGTAIDTPTIYDLVLNEINLGETPTRVPGGTGDGTGPGGDVRFSADIDAHGAVGSDYFQWSTSKDFSSATKVPMPAGTLDVHTGALDYHFDLPISTFGASYTGPIYWRASADATSADPFGRTTSQPASFYVTGGSTISNVVNLGGNDGGNDVVASGGGSSGPAAPVTESFSVYGHYGNQIPACADPCPITATDITLPTTVSGTTTQPGTNGQSYSDYYVIHGTPGQNVTITATSDPGDVYLLHDSTGHYISPPLLNLAKSGGSYSQYYPASGSVGIPGDGILIIEVSDFNSYGGAGYGDAYSFSVS